MRRSVLDDWIRQKEGWAELSREKIEAMQLKKINLLLAKTKQKGKFYQCLPEKISSLEEMKKIPLLTEQQLITNHRGMLLLSQSEVSKIITMYSSATTGLAKRLFFSASDIEKTVDFFACGLQEIASKGDRCLVWMPANMENSVGSLIARALGRIKVEALICSMDETLDAVADFVINKKINCAVAMPFKMLSLMRYADKTGKSLPLTSVMISADSAPPFLKQELGERYALQVIEHYGSSESGLGGALECGAKNGMHIRENDLLIEIVDDKGNWVQKGETGNIVLTTLSHEAMPLIRYQTGDNGALSAYPCRCGSVLNRLQNVYRNATANEMGELDAILFLQKNVLDYRMLRKDNRIRIEVMLMGKVDREKIKEQLQRVVLQKGWGARVDVHWHVEKLSLHKPYYQAKRKIIAE